MASALVIENLATDGSITASSQELTMPASQVLTAQPSERWRSLSNSAYLILDKGALSSADTIMLGGLTCGENATVRLRLSTVDSTGAAGDIYDSGTIADGDPTFDVDYRTFLTLLDAPASYRYVRFDIADPDADYVEAGSILDGLSEMLNFNFVPGGTIQWNPRDRVEKTASGKTLIWPDNKFRSVALSFDFVEEAQRYGLFETLDRDKGVSTNILLMTDVDSTNLPRDSIFGLMTEVTPNGFTPIFGVFSKPLKIEERI